MNDNLKEWGILPTIIVLVILFSAILFVVVFYMNVLAIKKARV